MFRRAIGGMTLPALAIMGLVLAHTTTAQAQSTITDEIFVDVIVTLDESFSPGSHAANEAAAGAIAQSFGLTASNTYGTVLFGFSASVPVGRLTAFENDPRVLAVELVQPVTAAAPVDCSDPANADHKKCQGDDGGGGKPGGGGGKPGGGGGPPDATRIASSTWTKPQ